MKSGVGRFIKETLKVLAVLLLCGLFGVYLQVGIRNSRPEDFADEYFSYYVTNNYEKMYEMLEVKESNLINYDTFELKAAGDRIYSSINGYELSKPVKEGRYITYVITYFTGEEKTENHFTVTLRKQKKKYLLFFPVWKISAKGMYVNDYTIKVPKGAEISMDSIDISGYKKNPENDKDVYVIDKMFAGDHLISVTNDGIIYSKSQYVNEDDSLIEIGDDDFELMPNEKSKVFGLAADELKNVYTYVMDSTKTEDDFKKTFANTAEAQAKASEVYNYMSSAIQQEDGASLRVINMGVLTPSLQAYNVDSVTVKVEYDYNFVAVTGTSMLSGIIEEYTGNGISSALIIMNKINGEWQVVNINMNCIDYSKQDAS